MENLDRPKEIENTFQANQVKKQKLAYKPSKSPDGSYSSALPPNLAANNLREVPLRKPCSAQNLPRSSSVSTSSSMPVSASASAGSNKNSLYPNKSANSKAPTRLTNQETWDPYRLYAIGQIRRPKTSIQSTEEAKQLIISKPHKENQYKDVPTLVSMLNSEQHNKVHHSKSRPIKINRTTKEHASGFPEIEHNNPLEADIREFSKPKAANKTITADIFTPNQIVKESSVLPIKPSLLKNSNQLISLYPPPKSNTNNIPKVTSKPLNLADPGKWACTFIAAALEVINGVRPLSSLVRWAAPEVIEALAKRRFLISHNHHQQKRLTNLFRIHKQRIFEPANGVAEVSVSVEINNHVRACALRLEIFKNRWLVTALELG